MVVNQKVTGTASSIPGGLASGGFVSLAVTLIGAAVLALLIDKGVLAQTQLGYGVMVMILLASFLGASVSAAKIKRQRLAACMLAGVVYFGILLSITALFFGGQYQAVGVTGFLILGGSGCAALLGLRQGRGTKHRKKRGYNR